MNTSYEDIPGTIMFDGQMATLGYPLNKMCYSFNDAEARNAFVADEEAYCQLFGLSDAQKKAIKDRDVLELLRQGGSIYYLAKFAGILGLNVQDVGALQTGMSVDEFKAMLVKAGE
ncbi:protocatechuate 4,5-dioxygenase subunit alpha [Nitrincola nitratireducens]|uniref:Protocatechuate 4,5-dioxygenase alpha chain n=1 Tax=Nitrincola nitratireducens TaxID=1229521 RepID=W9UST0_9GAMM|nr:protocatechuate 4,5-dioxygenase subunit alpha [Nitrincola nitratireducens]EXJ10154.1 Protocatechuate 4,5-dioxygenase alpha chain [Nitrincola nitratireducens]